MSRREKLRAEVKADREKDAETARQAQTLPGLLALVERARAAQKENGKEVPTPAQEPFNITPRMRAEAAARAEVDSKRLPDN